MPPSPPPNRQALIDDRVAAVEAILQCRDSLLRQMFDMVRERENAGTLVRVAEDSDQELSLFLERYSLAKDPEAGSILNLPDNPFLQPLPHQPDSPSARESSTGSASPAATVSPLPNKGKEREVRRSAKSMSVGRRSVSRRSDSEAHTPAPTKRARRHVPTVSNKKRPPRRRPPTPQQEHDDDTDGHDELDLIGSGASSPRSVRSRSRHSSRSAIVIPDTTHDDEPPDELSSIQRAPSEVDLPPRVPSVDEHVDIDDDDGEVTIKDEEDLPPDQAVEVIERSPSVHIQEPSPQPSSPTPKTEEMEEDNLHVTEDTKEDPLPVVDEGEVQQPEPTQETTVESPHDSTSEDAPGSVVSGEEPEPILEPELPPEPKPEPEEMPVDKEEPKEVPKVPSPSAPEEEEEEEESVAVEAEAGAEEEEDDIADEVALLPPPPEEPPAVQEEVAKEEVAETHDEPMVVDENEPEPFELELQLPSSDSPEPEAMSEVHGPDVQEQEQPPMSVETIEEVAPPPVEIVVIPEPPAPVAVAVQQPQPEEQQPQQAEPQLVIQPPPPQEISPQPGPPPSLLPQPIDIDPRATSVTITAPPLPSPVLAPAPITPLPISANLVFSQNGEPAPAAAEPSDAPAPEPQPHVVTEQEKQQIIALLPEALRELGFNPTYTLPPLKLLPAEYQRKSRKSQRKKDKGDKDRNGDKADGGGRRDKDEWTPLGLNRWSATILANPVADKVSRASKCLSTRDWTTAMKEVMLVRTFERIEALKKTQRWSFRQPKKQRGVGGLMKTHWDYLLDEVKWMRTDFREERKWKIALAYELAREVVKWHKAGTMEERMKQGICVDWKKPEPRSLPLPPPLEESTTGDVVMSEGGDGTEVDQAPPSPKPKNLLLMVDYGSDEEDEEEQQEIEARQRELDSTSQEITAAIEDSIANSLLTSAEDEEANPFLDVKREEIEEASAMVEDKDQTSLKDAMDIDNDREVSAVKQDDQAIPLDLSGLKNSSDDPVLGSQPISRSSPGDVEGRAGSTRSKSSSRSTPYPQVREKIAYTDDLKLFISLEDLTLSDDPNSEPLELSAVFPDLQPYDFLDVAPATPPLMEGKRKSDRRSDRDDPHKRAEDTTYSKLTPVNKLMLTKPTILGPLQPARRWKNGQWVNMDEPIPVPDLDPIQVKFPADAQSDLFSGPRGIPPPILNMKEPEGMKEHRKRSLLNEDTWTPRDDVLLKSLVDKYRTNWALIAECFNSMRPTSLKADKRTKWDCYMRWQSKFGAAVRAAAAAAHLTPQSPGGGPGSPNPASGSGSMMTRGVKRLAGHVSLSSPLASYGAGGVDARKRRRHLFVHDAIRRIAKKRELHQRTLSQQRKAPFLHATHADFSKMPWLSAAELTRMKAERENKEAQELAMRRRNEEARQRELRAAQLPQNPIAVAQLAAAQNPAGQRINPVAQGVPQIRNQVNISQQQRIPTPISNNGNNGRIATPLNPQQTQRALQALAAQNQAQAQAHAQAQAQGAQIGSGSPQSHPQGVVIPGVAVNGTPLQNNHLSPTFDASSPPSQASQSSPPRSSATPSNAVSPRPPSAQANSLTQVAQVPSNAIPRVAGVQGVASYYPVNMTQGHFPMNQEQLNHAVRMQTMIVQAQQAQAHQAQQQHQQQLLAQAQAHAQAQQTQVPQQNPSYPS